MWPVTFNWSHCSFTVPKIQGPLTIMLNLFCLCFKIGRIKPQRQPTSLQHGLPNIFKPTVDTYCSGKKNSFQNISAPWQCTWSAKSSAGDVHEINIIVMPANTASIPQPKDRRVILTCRSYWRNTSHKAIAAIDSGFSDGSTSSKLKIFWKDFTILDSLKILWNSWGEVNISTLTGMWRKLIPAVMDDIWGVCDFGGGSNCRFGGNSKRTELEVEPEDVIELL